MHEVRDRSVRSLQKVLDGSARSRRSVDLRRALVEGGRDERVLERLVLESVDVTLANVLTLLDQYDGELTLLVHGHDAARESDGLAGELYGDRGWMTSYSAFGEPNP